MWFFSRWRISEPQTVEDFVPIALEVRRKKALKVAVQTQQQIDSPVLKERDIWEDTVSIIARVATQIRDTLDAQTMSFPENNFLQHITLDETTQVMIPLYLQRSDIFVRALGGRTFLLLSEINEEMVKILTGIDIQLQSWEMIISTQMYRRMNLNENVGTLGDYILSQHKLYLKHVS